MLTKNYNIVVNCAMYSSDVTLKNVTDINGIKKNASCYSREDLKLPYGFGNYAFGQISNNRYCSIFVGTGDKEESPEDFALENIIPDSDLIVNGGQVIFSENRYFFTKALTYTGVTDVTINEVAFYQSVRPSSGDYTILCLARQKVPPINVSQGDSFTVSMIFG